MGQIVGAYPVYNKLDDPTEVVAALAASPLVDGLEVPFAGGRIAIPQGARDDWQYVVTLIPETVGRLKTDPDFGLASRDGRGRQAAIDLVRSVHAEVAAGDRQILAVEVHSAPTHTAEPDAFTASLAEIAEWDWGTTQVVVEHCDDFTGPAPEKGFLVSVNWARSVIESRDPATGLAHVQAAAERGLLAGLLFSSVADRETAFGAAWGDLHLPPQGAAGAPAGSLLDAAAIAACRAAAGGAWYGFKIGAPVGIAAADGILSLLTTAELVG